MPILANCSGSAVLETVKKEILLHVIWQFNVPNAYFSFIYCALKLAAQKYITIFTYIGHLKANSQQK